jgi:hypothetical protein
MQIAGSTPIRRTEADHHVHSVWRTGLGTPLIATNRFHEKPPSFMSVVDHRRPLGIRLESGPTGSWGSVATRRLGMFLRIRMAVEQLLFPTGPPGPNSHHHSFHTDAENALRILDFRWISRVLERVFASSRKMKSSA